MEKRLLRPDEAAALLSVSRWTIYRWLEEGKIRGTKLGKGTLRIFRESLDVWINENELQNSSHPVQRVQQAVDPTSDEGGKSTP